MSLSACSGGVLIHLAALNKRGPPSSRRTVVLQEVNKKERDLKHQLHKKKKKRERHIPQEDTTHIKYPDEISETVVVPLIALNGSMILKPFPGLSIKKINTQKRKRTLVLHKKQTLCLTQKTTA